MKILDRLRDTSRLVDMFGVTLNNFIETLPAIHSSTDGTWRRMVVVEESLARVEQRLGEALQDRRPVVVWGVGRVEASLHNFGLPREKEEGEKDAVSDLGGPSSFGTINLAASSTNGIGYSGYEEGILYLSKGERGVVRVTPYVTLLGGEIRSEPPFVITEALVGKHSCMACAPGAARSVVLPAVSLGLPITVHVVWPKEADAVRTYNSGGR